MKPAEFLFELSSADNLCFFLVSKFDYYQCVHRLVNIEFLLMNLNGFLL